MSFANKTMTATTTFRNVVLHGYLRKLKTMKKKYFVLYSDGEKPARLEYFDNEKKFRARQANPKRSIVLKSCFHINKRIDKHKFVISLYTKDDCFCIVFDTEAELNTWLQSLLSLHRIEDIEGDKVRGNIEHVWQVQVQRRGIAEERGIIGNYHLCLSDKSLTLVRIGQRIVGPDNRVPSVEFLLTTIRRCGDSQCYFYMEVGRHSVIGPGELWMGTEDPFIAQNMHTTIIAAMSAVTKREEFGPIARIRSSSANETSRPSQMLLRRQTHVGTKPFNASTSGEENSIESTTSTLKAENGSPISIRYLEQVSTVPQQQSSSSAHVSTKNSTITVKNSNKICEDDYVCHDGPTLAAASTVSHHRALSLPIATTTQTIGSSSNFVSPIVPNINNNVIKTTFGQTSTTNLISSTNFTIQPVHQRTRSLPLTEETVIQLNSLNSNASPRSSRDSINSKNNKSYNEHHHHHHHNNSHHQHIKSSSSISISTNQNINELNVPSYTNNNICTCSIENHDHHQVIPTVLTTTVENSIENDDDNNSVVHSVTLYNNIDTYGGQNDKTTVFKNIFNNKIFMGGGFIQSSYVGGLPLLQRGRSSNNCARSIGRERCDSLPTRNRSISDSIHATQQTTSMPPPRSIPLANRPHSMYTNRHSHSPPMLATPLSPSAGCSESDGSSLSIDETDGCSNPITPDEGGNWKYYNQRATGAVIPEENPDDFFYGDNNKRKSPDMTKRNGSLSLPINQTVRKGSPAPPSNYMEMYSPCGSSPGDHPGYLMMSPGVDLGRSLCTNSSGAHSRASSLAEDTENGCYVDTDQVEHYVDMEQSRRPATSEMSSAASSCSITSGTPSTDLRFAEYQLEKVVSRFTPDEEDASLLSERPLRAYSVGSRLEHNKRKLRVDLLASEHINSRARACSVGSKAKVARSDFYRGTIHTAPLSSITQHDAANLTNNNIYKSNKSSSAPILISKGPASIGAMDDLMEIDFAPTPPPTQSLISIQNSQSSAPMKMSLPMLVPTPKKYDGLDLLPSSKPSGYVEMKPAINEYEPMFPGARQDYSYMDMKPVGSASSKSSLKTLLCTSTSPIKSPKTISSLNRNNNYMSMSSQNQSASQSPRGSLDEYLNMSPTIHRTSHHRAMEIDLPKTLSAPEGYTEMFWNKPNTSGNNNNNNNISEKPVSDEYIYMNAGCPSYNTIANKNEPRLSSLPIDIQLRKKSNIPLTLATATRCDSKDSGIVTPSGSHPAMFPFSPSSQTSIDDINIPRKCLVDGSSGTLRLSEEEEENPTTASFTKKIKVLNLDVPTDTSTCPIRPQVDVLSNEYADMTLGGGSSTTATTKSKFVNHLKLTSDSPTVRTDKRPLIRATSVLDSLTDGIMNANVPRKLSAPIQQSIPITTASPKKSILVTILPNSNKIISVSNTFAGFKPIPSNSDEMLMRNIVSPTNPVISRQSPFSRQLSERPISSHTNSSGYEMLHIKSDTNISYQGGQALTTRPNSVNSEKISKKSTTSLTRPNSVNCDRLSTTSTSSSTSTLCGSSSSSSTLCGSKCQSPSQNIRPPSFSESESIGSTYVAITSRPASVSSERGLHYASLDLPPSTDASKSNAKLKVDISIATTTADLQQSSKSSSGDSSTSPSPNANNVYVEQPSLGYAQIDFEKSNELVEMNTHGCSPTKQK